MTQINLDSFLRPDNKKNLLFYLLLFIIFVFIPFLFFKNTYFFFFQSIVSIFLIVHRFKTRTLEKKNIIQSLKNIDFYLNNTTRDHLIHFPLPMTIFDYSGKIIWYNHHFEELIDNSDNKDFFGLDISDVLPLNIDTLIEHYDNSINLEINFSNRVFQVIGNIITRDRALVDGNSAEIADINSLKPGDSIVLYMVNRTKDYNKIKKLESRLSCCGLIVIDNYDELLKNNPTSEHSRILAEIDTHINDWAFSIGGIINKYETGKYSLIAENDQMQNTIASNIKIMEQVKDIKVNDSMPVTLSIGIGINGQSLSECDKFARGALDLALGRGGDQAVVKDGEKLLFFGGMTPEIEKYTRVKTRAIAGALKELCLNASKVFIMGHASFDADVLGAAIGIAKGIMYLNREAYIILGVPLSPISSLFSLFKDDNNYSKIMIQPDKVISLVDEDSILIVVDTHKPSYVECPTLLNKFHKIVVIDHHRQGPEYIENVVLKYHESYASSTCEMVTEILQYMAPDILLSVKEAQILYAGIITDTKNFTFKTGVRTFEAASYLRKQGVDTINVKRLLQSDIDTFSRKSYIISKVSIYKECIAISSYEDKDADANILSAQAADELLNISGISASFVLCKKDDIVNISGRSLGNINVQLILEKMGGGGHLTMAGAQIDGSMDEAIKILYNSINSYLVEFQQD